METRSVNSQSVEPRSVNSQSVEKPFAPVLMPPPANETKEQKEKRGLIERENYIKYLVKEKYPELDPRVIQNEEKKIRNKEVTERADGYYNQGDGRNSGYATHQGDR